MKYKGKDDEAVLMRFLDSEGRVKIWPAKMTMKLAVLEYIALKFEAGSFYTESEVNVLISEWHTFGDLFILRRGIVDAGYVRREKDGSRYWREEARDRG